MIVLALHAAVLPIAGVLAGRGVAHSLLEGGLLPATLAAAAGTSVLRRRKVRSALATVGLLTTSGLVVHFSGGYIEAHFHFFVMVAILGLYEDWLPFGLAFGYVFIHHGVFGTVSPESVYNHEDAIAHPWRWAIVHGAAISMAGILGIASWRLNEELRAKLRVRETELATSNEELARANEDLKQLDQMKTNFIATASHELRTPLTSVTGFTKTMLRRWDELDEEARRRFAEIVNEQGERLARLVSDLLDLSRIDAGQLSVHPERIEVRPVVESLAEATEAPVEVEVADGVTVYADRGHIEQMLSNYIENAAKYGRPPLRIEATSRDGSIELAVHDHGDGVPEALVPRLFDRFTQAPESRGRGTGLGLAIVQGLARANGGDAWYARNGTTAFGIRLPAADAERRTG